MRGRSCPGRQSLFVCKYSLNGGGECLKLKNGEVKVNGEMVEMGKYFECILNKKLRIYFMQISFLLNYITILALEHN